MKKKLYLLVACATLVIATSALAHHEHPDPKPDTVPTPVEPR